MFHFDFISSVQAAWGGGGALPNFHFVFYFPCSADHHQRAWSPRKEIFCVRNQHAEFEKQQQQQLLLLLLTFRVGRGL